MATILPSVQAPAPAPAPFLRYDPARGPSAVQYRHVDPHTGLIVPPVAMPATH